MKILLVGAELFHAEGRKDGRTGDGQTDKQDEANGQFLQFCKRAENGH